MQPLLTSMFLWCRHVHAYERCNRVYNYTVDPCGPVHVTIGDGGVDLFLALNKNISLQPFSYSFIYDGPSACCSEIWTRGLLS